MLGINMPVHLFPFHMIGRGSRIVIWGMGNIGKQYLRQIMGIGYCKIAFVVDKNIHMENFGVPMYGPEYIQEHREFDYLVIAIGDTKIAQEIKTTLLGWGIDPRQIVHEPASYRQLVEVSDMDIHLPDMGFLRNVKKLLRIYAVLGKSFVRCGAKHDGGYIMLDDFKARNGIAYSFGINHDVSWDDDLADRGYDVFMYDHTIKKLPIERKEFHFFPKGIADMAPTNELDDLDSFMQNNGHMEKKNMILKMDVEGAEWGFLDRVSSETLQKFDQIILEIHKLFDKGLKSEIISGLNKINTTHGVVHVHANNYAWIFEKEQMRIADTLEVTWVNKMTYNLQKTDAILPIPLDSPNCKNAFEVVLGEWNNN